MFSSHPANSSAFASADFDSPDDSTYFFEGIGGGADIKDIVSQTLSRHITELSSPKPSTSMSSWRKRLRELMLVQTENVLDFLLKPSTEQKVVGPIESLLRKYSLRKEVDHSVTKPLKDLLSPGGSIEEEINECISKSGPSTITQVRSQVSSLLEMYKDLGEKILESENQLKLRVEKLGKLYTQVASVLELQVSPETEDLLKGMEKYLSTAALDLNIEGIYKDLLQLYGKHIALRETIQMAKLGTCLPSEPWCSICLSDTIAYAIVPCGHTYCVGCCRKMVYDCGMCRTRIKERLKIYIS
jgi:hypothetical protein